MADLLSTPPMGCFAITNEVLLDWLETDLSIKRLQFVRAQAGLVATCPL
jgi:hypothetical protein